MELPTFLNKITGQDGSEKKEYFWAVQIWDEGVKSAIWTVGAGRAKVIALGSLETWKGNIDSFVEAIDNSLATCLERFSGLGEEPSKVIFGLPYDWLSGEKILPVRQQMLQSACDQLEFNPLGFVLTVDALNHHLKDVEGVPPSVIFISPHKDKVLVALIELGKVLGVEMVSRSSGLSDDVYEGLSRFAAIETLPARMLLFDSENMEAARQILLNFPWEQKLPFLHCPKIEILPQDFDIAAVCLAGGSEVAISLGLTIEEKEERVEEEKEVAEENPVQQKSLLGFVKGRDIKEELKQEGKTPELRIVEEQIPKKEVIDEILENRAEQKAISNLKRRLPQFPRVRLPPRFFLVFGVFILLVGGSLFAFVWFLLKTQITVFVSPKLISKEFDLKIDPNQDVSNEKNLILPGRVMELETSGDKETSATGTKTVGDKAKGEVTLFNNTFGKKRFAAGTTIAGPQNLKFVLDEDVEIASESGVPPDYRPGRSKVHVTASDIGASYNLAAETVFTVSNFPIKEVSAENESAFSGGTSRQIQAVSEDDQKKLLASLTEELKEQGKRELNEKVQSGETLIEESVASKESARKFDHQVGDEASSLHLSLKMKISALTFSEEDFRNFAQKQMTDSNSEGYEIRKEAIQPNFEIKKIEKDGSALAKVSISINLLPKFDSQSMTEEIKGKTFQEAYGYLAKLPGYLDSEIVTHPAFFSRFSILPPKEQNIKIRIQAK